jgi:hypothetical protein
VSLHHAPSEKAGWLADNTGLLHPFKIPLFHRIGLEHLVHLIDMIRRTVNNPSLGMLAESTATNTSGRDNKYGRSSPI